MRKIVLMMSVSLDGFIEGPNREIDWHMVDDELHRHVEAPVVVDTNLGDDEARLPLADQPVTDSEDGRAARQLLRTVRLRIHSHNLTSSMLSMSNWLQ